MSRVPNLYIARPDAKTQHAVDEAEQSANAAPRDTSEDDGRMSPVGQAMQELNLRPASSNSDATSTPLSPTTSIAYLPTEIHDAIVDELPRLALTAYGLADYARARRLYPALFPRITRVMLQRLASASPAPIFAQTNLNASIMNMPNEIVLDIIRRLPRSGVVNFTLAYYNELAAKGVMPRLTQRDLDGLALACRREEG